MKFCISEEQKTLSGIYKITNTKTGLFYIGSTFCFKKRYVSHLCEMKAGRHYAKKMLRSWLKHGPDYFEMTVVEVCEEKDLREREQFYLDNMRPYDPTIGYNQRSTSDVGGDPALARQRRAVSRTGVRHTPETREKIRLTKAGWKPSKEHLNNLQEGLRQAREARSYGDKISKGLKGKTSTARKLAVAQVHLDKKILTDRQVLSGLQEILDGASCTKTSLKYGVYYGFFASVLRTKPILKVYAPLLHATGYLHSGATCAADLQQESVRAKIDLNIKFPKGKDNLIEDPEEYLSFLTTLGLQKNGTNL